MSTRQRRRPPLPAAAYGSNVASVPVARMSANLARIASSWGEEGGEAAGEADEAADAACIA